MPLSNEESVQEYAKLVFELRGGLENLLEFVSTFQPPTDDFEVPGMTEGSLEDLRRLHRLIGDAGEVSLEMFE